MEDILKKPSPEKRLSDSERHKRFVDMAKKVEASEEAADFDQAFRSIVKDSPIQKDAQKDDA
jgi:hypothetical protein